MRKCMFLFGVYAYYVLILSLITRCLISICLNFFFIISVKARRCSLRGTSISKEKSGAVMVKKNIEKNIIELKLIYKTDMNNTKTF